MSAFYRETEHCIRCFGKVEFYTGHVKLDEEIIVAGWCARCYGDEEWVEGGYRGKWTAQMGLRGRPRNLPAAASEPSCIDPPPPQVENPYERDPDAPADIIAANKRALGQFVCGQRNFALSEVPLPPYYPTKS